MNVKYLSTVYCNAKSFKKIKSVIKEKFLEFYKKQISKKFHRTLFLTDFIKELHPNNGFIKNFELNRNKNILFAYSLYNMIKK